MPLPRKVSIWSSVGRSGGRDSSISALEAEHFLRQAAGLPSELPVVTLWIREFAIYLREHGGLTTVPS